ncbi:MAG TPA: biopolymer transporter ExbD [Oceanipulchritudo sp.]|nr:biopolymer transporter ExbD [Oceanipulchritudo sp.]
MQKRKRRTEEAFQMAPMIDMVFLLLVFFMTVSTMAREARPEMELPVSGTATVPSEVPPRDIVSLVAAEGGYRIFRDNRETSLAELPDLLREAAGAVPSGELLFRGPPGLPWKELSGLLEVLGEAPVEDLVFATFED